MAIMLISEYEDLAVDGRGNVVQAGQEPAIAEQNITFTVSTASAAFNERTRFVRISCDTEAFLKFGASPTAVTAQGVNVQADTPEFFGVVKGQKVAAVT